MADPDDPADGLHLVFKALADPTRRFLLDLLHERDGRTLTELESELSMSRFGVMKHLKLLDDVAYVRYASVYRDFRETQDFARFLGEEGLSDPGE